MDIDNFELAIFNDNFEGVLDKDDHDSLNDSIFLQTQFDEIQQIPDSDSPTVNESKRGDRKQVRHVRKDDFDYNAYIKEEMKNYDTETMTENLRKHMIQKIRNRMSAQRSRLRQKSMQECMEKENEALKSQNMHLRREVLALREENEKLRVRVKSLESSKTTECTSEEEKTNSESSVYIREKKIAGGFGIPKTPLFLALAIVCAFIIPGGAPVDNPAVKLGGVVPMITTSLPQNSRALKTMDRMCSDYCKGQRVLCDKDMDRAEALLYLNQLNKISVGEAPDGKEKQIELFDKVNAQKLICFDPESPVETENIFRIIVNTRSTGKLDTEEVYLGQFERLSTE